MVYSERDTGSSRNNQLMQAIILVTLGSVSGSDWKTNQITSEYYLNPIHFTPKIRGEFYAPMVIVPHPESETAFSGLHERT